jgi:putative hemolysin
MSALFFIFLLTIANGVFAMSEAAVISARKAKLQQQANQGNARAQAALNLANEPSRFLSTVQIGITLIGIFSGAIGQATLSANLALWLNKIPLLAPYSEPLSTLLVVLGLTYLSLVVGELVPKRLALNNPERIAGLVAGPMQLLSIIALPVVKLLSFSTENLVRLLGVRPSDEPPITEEEIKVLLEQGTLAGIFEEAEQNMVSAVFRLHDQRAGDLMTPRPDIIWLDLDDEPANIIETITHHPYSRFPVSQGDLDNVVGVVQAKDLLSHSLTGQPLDLPACLKPALFIPESVEISTALELFKKSDLPQALVLDEYGGTQGLVTLTDIMEALVGGVEADQPQAVQREDGSWLLDGGLDVDQFKELFEIGALPDEERGYYQTLGGLVMMCLGRIPTVGDHFNWRNLRFEVMDMDGKRVDKVLVMPQPAKHIPPSHRRVV